MQFFTFYLQDRIKITLSKTASTYENTAMMYSKIAMIFQMLNFTHYRLLFYYRRAGTPQVLCVRGGSAALTASSASAIIIIKHCLEIFSDCAFQKGQALPIAHYLNFFIEQ